METGNTPDFQALLQQVMASSGDPADTETQQKDNGERGNRSQMLEKLMAMLGNTEDGEKESDSAKMSSEKEDSGEHPESSAAASDRTAFPRELIGRFLDGKSRDKRNKLLGALKPYLSPGRCEILDRAMSAMQLGELLGDMYPVYGQFLRGSGKE